MRRSHVDFHVIAYLGLSWPIFVRCLGRCRERASSAVCSLYLCLSCPTIFCSLGRRYYFAIFNWCFGLWVCVIIAIASRTTTFHATCFSWFTSAWRCPTTFWWCATAAWKMFRTILYSRMKVFFRVKQRYRYSSIHLNRFLMDNLFFQKYENTLKIRPIYFCNDNTLSISPPCVWIWVI